MRAPHIQLLLFFLIGTGLAAGNDGAASTAAGGIQLVREPRIAMRTEKLTIAREKITVEYDFSNDTDNDITTEVAFPIPPYTFAFDDPGAPAGFRGFNDFEAWVNNAPIKCEKQVTAWVNEKDVTDELKRLGIDANTFGHFDFVHEPNPQSPEIARLPKPDQQALVQSGLVDGDTGFPLWTVKKTYYWRQTFPAHATIHIRHQYQPIIGFTPVELAPPKLPPRTTAAATRGMPDAWTMSKEDAQLLTDACVTPQLREKLVSEAKSGNGYAEAFWVDYILTTANTWKTPISDFRLIVERPQDEESSGPHRHWYVSFCWDGLVRRVDKDHFEADARDFVPNKELHVAFLGQ